MSRNTKQNLRALSELLKIVPIFAALSARELKSVAQIAKESSFSEGDEICREGETGYGLHVVVEGEVKVEIGGRTRRRMGPGAFFGEIALLDGGPRTATVIAETPVRTLVIARWNLQGLLRKNPTMATKMLEEVCRRLRTADRSLTA